MRPFSTDLLRSARTSRGFTIVELLIVIVVIGILAGLVLNSYSGAQRSARNAQTAVAVQAYRKGLIAYSIINGAYPNYNAECLGDGYPGGTCYGGQPINAAFSTALKTVMGSTLPTPGLSGTAVGAAFYTNQMTVDGTPTAILSYTIDITGDPNLKCPIGPIIARTGSPTLLTSNPVGPRSNGSGFYAGECYVPLPDATKQ